MVNKEIYDLIGKILNKKPEKVKDKKSAHYGIPFYRLTVNIKNQEEVKEILAFECWFEKKERGVFK